MSTAPIAQGPVDVNVSRPCACDHHETCPTCVPSLYKPKAIVVKLTAEGVNRIGDTIAELRMENSQLRAAIEATSNAEETKEAAGHRLTLEVIERYDTESTLIYADPPYVFSTRTGIHGRTKSTQGYRHEMSDDEHRKLAEVLHAAKGMVVLSGYPSDLYDNDLYADWERFERRHVADGGLFRTEVVWINQACVEDLSISRGGFF